MPSLYTSLTILSSYIIHVHVLQNSDRVQETTLTVDTHRNPLNQGAEGWSLLSGLYYAYTYKIAVEGKILSIVHRSITCSE